MTRFSGAFKPDLMQFQMLKKSLQQSTIKMLILMMLAFLTLSACSHRPESVSKKSDSAKHQTIIDMRGSSVEVPLNPKKIISISDGMVETVMANFGLMDRLIAIGSSCLQRSFTYEIPGKKGKHIYSEGMNPIRLLYPFVAELPLVANSGLPIDLERIAALQPDLIIIREGCCSLPNLDDPKNQQALLLLESMKIPLVVLKGTTQFDPPDLEMFYKEISILGKIFGQEEKAQTLSQYLKETIDFIASRTRAVSQEKETSVLIMGLSPKAREGGGAAVTKGSDTIEGYFIEHLIHAQNAFQGKGGRNSSMMLNTEQVLAINPDVIVLPTASGYHPPEELYDAPYYAKFSSLSAVRAKRVIALPWTPCNCSKRIEFPLELLMMGKITYPNAFEDIRIAEWSLDFYQKIYGTDSGKAIQIRSAQWLDWTIDTF